jgi:PBSX family phage terminase large subunit
MILSPWQNSVAECLSRFRVVVVGRRAGKTALAVEEIKGKAIYYPNKIAYIATTFAQARDIAWEELKKQLKPVFACPPNESRLEIKTKTQKGGESIITLRGWESIETLRGLSFDFLVIDEVASMRDFWSNWQEVIRPTLTDRKGEVMFLGTPKGFNHLYDLYNMENKDKDYKSFHYTSYDNPYIPKEEIDKAKQEMSETRFAQEFLADFRKTEGLVYKEFSRERHLYEQLPKDKHFDYLGGVDFGFTNPAAVAHIYRDSDGNYYVENEWYQKGRTENQIADYVLSCKFNAVYPDPENPSAIKVLAEKGAPIKEVIKGKGSVKVGINKIRDLLKQNKFYVNKHCINLISEFESYCYPDYLIGSVEPEEPLKENDHLLDACRYVVFMDYIVKKRIVSEKPRPVLTESRYEGKVPVSSFEEDDITEEELARM